MKSSESCARIPNLTDPTFLTSNVILESGTGNVLPLPGTTSFEIPRQWKVSSYLSS